MTIYMDNETYIPFLELPEEVRTDLRQNFVKEAKKAIKAHEGKK